MLMDLTVLCLILIFVPAATYAYMRSEKAKQRHEELYGRSDTRRVNRSL